MKLPIDDVQSRIAAIKAYTPRDPPGPSAFPQTVYDYMQGMTLRDYFAGKAMQGFCNNPESPDADFEVLAQIAYELADEMLKVRRTFHEDEV